MFFSRITLEDKLGQQYEPYIFAALNSAKVMLVIGSKREYFDAVWVKNEWSRFLALMKKDRSKLLIPCYRVPPCGFSYSYSCPIPPAQNRIKADLPAGEKVVIYNGER